MMIHVITPAALAVAALLCFYFSLFFHGGMRPAPPPVKPARPRCAHARTVPVDLLVTGETVARLCLKCGDQLPPEGNVK